MSKVGLGVLERSGLIIHPLSDELIAVIKESQQQIKKGKFLSEYDANKEIEELLDK